MSKIDEDIFNKEIWWVLKRIKKEYLATPDDKQVHFSFVPGEVLIIGQTPTAPSVEDQKQALRILRKIGAIKLDSYTHLVKMTGKNSFTGEPIINGVYLDILQPKFDEIYEEFKTRETYKQRVPEQVVPPQVEIRELPHSQSKKLPGSTKLIFYPDDGHGEYRGSVWPFKGKARALLTIFNENKNTSFPLENIQKHCNPLINNPKHYFRSPKDINDTIREIRNRLNVNKGEYFPVHKQENSWIWLEK